MKMYAKKVAANEDKRKKAMVEEEDDGGTFALYSSRMIALQPVNLQPILGHNSQPDGPDLSHLAHPQASHHPSLSLPAQHISRRIDQDTGRSNIYSRFPLINDQVKTLLIFSQMSCVLGLFADTTIKTVNKTEYVATKTMEDTSDDAKFLNDLFSNFLVVLIFLDILRRENDDEDEDGGAIDERNIIGEVKLAQRAAACYLASNTLTSITHITVPLCP
ncbi:hypothetical protein JOM56_004709 [Amanita muscaria]